MDKQKAFRSIKDTVSDCKLCKWEPNHNPIPVVGMGNLDSKIMIIGEAPGFVEDCINLPLASNIELRNSICSDCKNFETCFHFFLYNSSVIKHVKCLGFEKDDDNKISNNKNIARINTAGQLLEDCLNALKIKRADMFLTNIVLCRPTCNNDTPSTEQIANCANHIAMLMVTILPDYIITLGKVATSIILNINRPMKELIGYVHRRQLSDIIQTDIKKEVKILSCWHPAYIMRQPKGSPERIKASKDLYETIGYAAYKTGLIDDLSKIKLRADSQRLNLPFIQQKPEPIIVKKYRLSDIERYIETEIKLPAYKKYLSTLQYSDIQDTIKQYKLDFIEQQDIILVDKEI